MSGSGAGPLVPTFHGFVSNSMDGLVLFEACLSGKLHHVPRRPHDRERSQLIKSGSIFIYEENASGIKRWTDGVAWSPSRILGNFLIYRELEKPFPPGEKKRAMKRKRQSIPGEPYPRRDSEENDAGDQKTPLTPPTPTTTSTEVKAEPASSEAEKEMERALIGSLVDSYGFRPDGLVKKTMSIAINGISHHMVSYYKVDDVKNQTLPRPLSDPRLQGISVRPELYLKQNFRAPVEETEHYAVDGNSYAHPQIMYPMTGGPYAVRPGQYFGGQQQYQPMYAMPQSASASYGSVSTSSWPNQQGTGAVAYGSHPAYNGQSYGNYYKNQGQAGKIEDGAATSQSMSYGSQYAPSYSQIQRGSAQSTPAMVQSAYQTPVPQHTSTFGSMSTRPSYNNTMPSPTAGSQAHNAYGSTTTQQYAVRSPTQSYAMQSAPISAVAQSPNLASKTDNSAGSGSATNDMAYRNAPYAVGTTSQAGDMGGLGISSHSYQTQQTQHYPSYGSSTQQYRASSDMSAAPSGNHYGHG